MQNPDGSANPPWAARDVPVLPQLRRAARAVVPRNTRFRLYFKMLDTPGVSELYVASRGRLRHRRIHAGTQLVIEAFPSSGNTFSRQAFLLANPDIDLNDVCSHTHSPRIVHKAVRAKLPCIVLIRDPRDAVSSMVQRFTGIELPSAFRYYQHYYQRLLPIKDEFVVAPFPRVVSDFSSVVEDCNQKYGAHFRTGAETEVSNAEVLETIERIAKDRHGGKVLEARISRPSSTRAPSAVYLRDIDAQTKQELDAAMTVWHQFTA